MNLGQYIAKTLLEYDSMDEINHQVQSDIFVDLVARKESEVERTAQVFNIPLEDLKYAFIAGGMIILSDDIWSKLENSNSYDITSIEDAVKLANQYSKKWKSTLSAIKNSEVLDPPMILNYDKDKYYLVSGNTLLMFYKALDIEPKVLLATIDLPNEKAFYLTEGRLNESQTATIGEFIKFAIKNLGLQNTPGSLTLSYDNKQAQDKRTFGFFDPHDKKIWVYVKNRNMADILRTLAHELVHRKQEEDGRLDIKSGETGSPIEDEANATAGVLLRNFGKINNSIYESANQVNELSGLNSAYQYDDSKKSNIDPTYTFATEGGIKYKVIFRRGKNEGEYERIFTDYDNYRPGLMTKENKAIPIYATVTKITLDFLDNNSKWNVLMINPISKGRYRVAADFIYNNIPKEKYNIEEVERVIYITKK